MSDIRELVNKDLHTPLNSLAIQKLRAHIDPGVSEQASPATDATGTVRNCTPVRRAGKILAAWVETVVQPGAGESMVFDLKVNGSSILTATLTVDHTSTAKTKIDLPLDTTKLNLAEGDIVTLTRVYTAGATPAPMTETVGVVLWA